MARWALFTASRYLESDRGPAGRMSGRDGRPFARPWRSPTERVVTAAQVVRARREQPRWPRLLGLGMMGVAAFAAVHPVDPIAAVAPVAPQVAPTVSAVPPGGLLPIAAMAPAGPCEGVPDRFAWREDQPLAGRRAVHLLDAGYNEIACLDGSETATVAVPAAVAARLAAGGTFHWFVTAETGAQGPASRLESFQVR